MLASIRLTALLVLLVVAPLLVLSAPSPLEVGLKTSLSSGKSGQLKKKESSPVNEYSSTEPDPVQEENYRFSVFMQILLPSMFNLFSNITSEEFKAQFQEPCRFDALLEIFSKLPPYFDKIGTKFPRNPELVAYYSMQLASTFLVNNGSLTMACLYNMLSLQTKLQSFSLDIMDNPESHPELVGKFGIVMKPLMAKLKQNTMMKIIEHVDKYDKNDNYFTITLFHIFNFVFVTISLVGILSNLFLIILLRRSSVAKKPVVTIRTGRVKSPRDKHSGSLKRVSGHHHHHHRSKSANGAGGGASAGSLSRSTSKNQRHKSPMPHKQRFTGSSAAKYESYNHYEGITLEKKPTGGHQYRLSRSGEYQQRQELIPLNDNGLELQPGGLIGPVNQLSDHGKRSRIYMNSNEIPDQLNVQIKSRLPKRSRSSRGAGGVKSTSVSVKSARMSAASILLRYIRRRYKTRLCIILIALCHSLYLLMNFVVMSQAGVAAVALKGLNQLNLACKVSFFLFPPTTAYNLLHQFAIWLLFYAIRAHSQKLRRQRSLHEYDCDEDYDIDLIGHAHDDGTDEDEDSDYDSRHLVHMNDDADEEEEDTLSITLTNNSNNLLSKQQQQQAGANLLMAPNGVPNHSYVKFNMNTVNTSSYSNTSMMNSQSTNQPILGYHPQQHHMHHHRHQPIYSQTASMAKESKGAGSVIGKGGGKSAKESTSAASFPSKRKNLLFAIFLFILLCIYNSQSLFLYSLAQLSDDKKNKPAETIYYCAFDETYSSLFQLLNQYVIPLLNLSLFAVLPLFFCSLIVLFDMCFLLRMYRENQKQYLRVKEIIEWPLYAYFGVYMVSQLPFALHQISDLALGTSKFPFVFPIFIHMKFTSKVGLVLIEMLLMCLAYSSDLYVWILCDKDMRRVVSWWLNKRILCRTYEHHSSSPSSANSSTSSSGGSRSGGNGGSTTCSRSSNFSDSNSSAGVAEPPVGRGTHHHHGLVVHNMSEKKMPLQSISPKNLTVNLNQAAAGGNHLSAANNSCGSSTISTSMTISSATVPPAATPVDAVVNGNGNGGKKKLNASTADVIKAKAAISALDMPPALDSMESPELSSRSSLSPASPVRITVHKQQSAPVGVKSPSAVKRADAAAKKDAFRMIDTDIDDIDDNDVSERCLVNTTVDSSYHHGQQQAPPSFDSAVQAKQTPPRLTNGNSHHHQYQNVM